MTVLPNITVLVVDDHPIVRDGISAVVDHQQDLDVIGQAADAAEAIALFDELHPDVTLMDLGLPDIGGIELISILRARAADARFIVLTANAGGSEIARALHAGANAYLFKNAPSEELLTAIRTVSSGGRYLSAAVGRTADAIASHPDLTARELEVLQWIARGHSNSQIASEIGVAEETIKSHVKNILTKLRVNSRSKAVARAGQLGLVRAQGI
jgi:DNA-binding NarL/FixJ family response regulator